MASSPDQIAASQYHVIGHIGVKRKNIAHQEGEPPELLLVDCHPPTFHATDTCQLHTHRLLKRLTILRMRRTCVAVVVAVSGVDGQVSGRGPIHAIAQARTRM